MKVTKDNVTLECEGCKEVTFEVEDFYFSLDREEGVMRLVISLLPFLGVEGWNFLFEDSSFFRLMSSISL